MKHKVWVMGVSLLLGLACAALTACGDDAEGTEEITGRLTSVSDSQIEIEVFDKGEGRDPGAASGGAVRGEGMRRPEGTPPADMKQGERPEGTPPADMDMEQGEKPEGAPPTDLEKGERPEGTPPADMPEAGQGGGKDGEGDPGNGRGMKAGEKKTFAINDSTKFYKQEGEEKTEITVDEVELGGMVSVAADGDTAVTVTVQMMGGGHISGD